MLRLLLNIDNRRVLLFVFAVISFMPSMQYMLLFNVMLGLMFYRTAGLKCVFVVVVVSFFSISAVIYNGEFFPKSYFSALLTFSSVVYLFLARKLFLTELDVVFFLKLHILISLLQIPVQVAQFISVYGTDLLLFRTYSSAGDVAFGTIYNSALLADKQILSILFLFFVRPYVSKLFFCAGFAFLGFSFLLIGANHTLAVLLLALLGVSLYKLFASFSARSLMLFPLVLLVGVSVYFIADLLFKSQLLYAASTINKGMADITYFGKVRAYINTLELFLDNPLYFLFGTGLGNFSSRAAFILSGEYLWQGVHPVLGTEMTPMHMEYMYPLWNKDVSSVQHLAGTIHQPFSSVLTIFAEVGGVFFLFCLLLTVSCFYRLAAVRACVTVFFVFVVGMLFVDNFLEFPRFIAPVFLVTAYFFDKSNHLNSRILLG